MWISGLRWVYGVLYNNHNDNTCHVNTHNRVDSHVDDSNYDHASVQKLVPDQCESVVFEVHLRGLYRLCGLYDLTL